MRRSSRRTLRSKPASVSRPDRGPEKARPGRKIISPARSRDRVGTMPSEVSMSGVDQVRRRTSEELEQKLAEAREQQAATAEILSVISSSPTDPRCVFTEIAASVSRLCDAHDAMILQVAGDDILHVVGPATGA